MIDHHAPFLFAVCLYLMTPSLSLHGQIQDLDIQGHRGCRGLLPENTIPGFLHALELGVTTLELDVVISKDRQVVVSHEPWMHHQICSHPDGSPVKAADKSRTNIYSLTALEAKTYDCGKRRHPNYPGQQTIAISKPLLTEVFTAVEIHCADHERPMPHFNIEIKSYPGWYDSYCPQPPESVRIVLETIAGAEQLPICVLQSFDFEVLREIKKQNQSIPVSMLVSRPSSFRRHIRSLGFYPEVYSPSYKFLSKRRIRKAQEQGIQVIPWTINSEKHMRKLIRRGVNGIITDYPDIAMRLKQELLANK